MRWVLPGGAVLGRNDPRRVACRPQAAVLERTSPGEKTVSVRAEVGSTVTVELVTDSLRKPGERLATTKQFLEVLAVLVGLIGTILALLGVSRK